MKRLRESDSCFKLTLAVKLFSESPTEHTLQRSIDTCHKPRRSLSHTHTSCDIKTHAFITVPSHKIQSHKFINKNMRCFIWRFLFFKWTKQSSVNSPLQCTANVGSYEFTYVSHEKTSVESSTDTHIWCSIQEETNCVMHMWVLLWNMCDWDVFCVGGWKKKGIQQFG